MEQLLRVLPPPFIAVSIAIAVVAGITTYRRRGDCNAARRWTLTIGWTGLAGGAAFGALITLLNYSPSTLGSSGLDTSLTLATSGQTLVNLILFWWVAVFLPLVRPVRFVGTFAVIATLSVLTESVQLVLPWRSADLMDVVLNISGGGILSAVGVYVARPVIVGIVNRVCSSSHQRETAR